MQSSNVSLVKGYYKRINKQPPWYKFTVFLKRRNEIHSQISEENKYERKVTALWFSFQYNWLDWRKLHWGLLVTVLDNVILLGNVILYSWHDFDWYDVMVFCRFSTGPSTNWTQAMSENELWTYVSDAESMISCSSCEN